MVKKRISATHIVKYRIHGALPEETVPQKWIYELPIQLRLWSVAVDTNDLLLKILLFYQIIELSYPEKTSYPDYLDSSKSPHPLTECKFVRHLVVHAGDVKGLQLKKYCDYLGVPELMMDFTDSSYMAIVGKKVDLLELEAKKAISMSL